MSRFNELRPAAAWRAAVTLIGIMALGCAAATLSSDESVDSVTIGASGAGPSDEAKPAGEPARTADEKQAGPASKAFKSPRSLFRCWQGGRMIFEGRGYGPLPQSQIAAELKPGDGASGRAQLLDMYEGLCVLELPK
jgi:hypothetical protein